LSKNTLSNKKWTLTAYPEGKFNANRDVTLVEETIDLDHDVESNKIVIEVDAVSVDAFIRTMLDIKAYHGAVSLNSPIGAVGYGTVIKAGSDVTTFKEGDIVMGMLQAATYVVVPCEGLQIKRNLPYVAPTASLGLFGISGLTAYIGMFVSPAKGPQKGETVVVSAAAGAVGCIASQMAKLAGARVIGIAGGPIKKKFILEELGLDGAIDYKDTEKSIGKQLDEQCPDGIDFFFDNVGGKTLDAVLERINIWSRISICGAISQYDSGKINEKNLIEGPSHYIKLAEMSSSMTGFNMMHYPTYFTAAITYLAWHHYRGNIKCPEHVEKGLEAFPVALEKLLSGGHCGRLIVDFTGKV
jgi:NADPH-dependent curcumin reductase CurA